MTPPSRVLLRSSLAALLLLSPALHAEDPVSTDDEAAAVEGADPADASSTGDVADEAEADVTLAADAGAEHACTPPCRAGFACVEGRCLTACNPPCAADEVCAASGACVPPSDLEPESTDPARTLSGVHGFGGVVLGGGFTLHANSLPDGSLDTPTTWGAFLFGLRAGVTVDQAEVSLEWAPNTFRPIIGDSEPALDNDESMHSFTGGFGYHLPLTPGAYWLLRLGAGLIATGDRTDFHGRLDLLAISVKTRYLLLDFSFPSVRYMSDFDRYHRWTGLFTVGVAYISP